MQLIIYQPVNADPKAFIDFWAARYTGYDEKFYEANVGQELTETRILEWFTWKNGTPLSEPKRKSVLRNFVARRGELDQVPRDETASDLLTRFGEGGAIWRIFWLHCWQPARFPIYDQHVHRAMRFIHAGVLEEIPGKDPQKIRVYLDSYMAFHAGFDGIGSRLVDKALWAFGRFLKENNFPREAHR
ncbi:MAG: hypothetical protein ABSG77_12490 [Candidatus Acidiferrum sp.]